MTFRVWVPSPTLITPSLPDGIDGSGIHPAFLRGASIPRPSLFLDVSTPSYSFLHSFSGSYTLPFFDCSLFCSSSVRRLFGPLSLCHTATLPELFEHAMELEQVLAELKAQSRILEPILEGGGREGVILGSIRSEQQEWQLLFRSFVRTSVDSWPKILCFVAL